MYPCGHGYSLIHSTGLVPECIMHTSFPSGSEHVILGQMFTICPSVVDVIAYLMMSSIAIAVFIIK